MIRLNPLMGSRQLIWNAWDGARFPENEVFNMTEAVDYDILFRHSLVKILTNAVVPSK